MRIILPIRFRMNFFNIIRKGRIGVFSSSDRDDPQNNELGT